MDFCSVMGAAWGQENRLQLLDLLTGKVSSKVW